MCGRPTTVASYWPQPGRGESCSSQKQGLTNNSAPCVDDVADNTDDNGCRARIQACACHKRQLSGTGPELGKRGALARGSSFMMQCLPEGLAAPAVAARQAESLCLLSTSTTQESSTRSAPEVGSSMKTMEGLLTSSTAMLSRLVCSALRDPPTCHSSSPTGLSQC